jgi:hypothetical protein
VLERLPEPLQTLVRRIILKLKIPFNQALAFHNLGARKWHCWRQNDSTRWRMVDLGRFDDERVRRYCISLMDEARFDVRRQDFLKHTHRFGWLVDFWPAINGAGMKPEDYPEWIRSELKADVAEPFGAGAVGLLMTVKEMYRWAREQKLEYLVVFEDDAVIHSSPRVELPEEFDVVFFNNRIQGDATGRVRSGWGNDGYVISRRGIGKMLVILEEVTADIDMLMLMYTASLAKRNHYITQNRNRNKPQLECYHVGPLVTHAGYFQSSIGLISKEARSYQS